MKSFVHEAKTIEQAIAHAWDMAGRPAHFSIKVLEAGTSSWMWWTNSPAKIAFSYESPSHKNEGSRPTSRYANDRGPRANRSSHEGSDRQETRRTDRAESNRENRNEAATTRRSSSARVNDHRGEERPGKRMDPLPEKLQEKPAPSSEFNELRTECVWDNEMVQFAQSWIKKTLDLFSLMHGSLSCIAEKNVLKVTINATSLGDDTRDKHLASSLSVLLIEAMRKQLKKNMRGCQVLITYGK